MLFVKFEWMIIKYSTTHICEKMGYIYLIREREFLIKLMEIYKIGMSKQEGCRRVTQYPKGSEIEIVLIVDDHRAAEQELLKIFDKKFINKPQYGREYYEGSRADMIKEIVNFIPIDPVIRNDRISEDQLKTTMLKLAEVEKQLHELKIQTEERKHTLIETVESNKAGSDKDDENNINTIDTRRRVHKDWIINNPVNCNEGSLKYYNRLSAQLKNPLSITIHTKLLREVGYTRRRVMAGTVWELQCVK